MHFLHRDDNTLCLTDYSPRSMHFSYKSLLYAILFGVFAISISLAIWFLGENIKDTGIFWYWFACFLASAFIIGTITTMKTRCNLEIKGSTKRIRYSLSTLFGKTEWERSFSAFKEVRIYRPIAGTGAGHATFSKVLLVTAQGEEIPLGITMFGTKDRYKARELTENLAEIMSLSVIEESSARMK